MAFCTGTPAPAGGSDGGGPTDLSSGPPATKALIRLDGAGRRPYWRSSSAARMTSVAVLR